MNRDERWIQVQALIQDLLYKTIHVNIIIYPKRQNKFFFIISTFFSNDSIFVCEVISMTGIKCMHFRKIARQTFFIILKKLKLTNLVSINS